MQCTISEPNSRLNSSRRNSGVGEMMVAVGTGPVAAMALRAAKDTASKPA
jgi:hypothetical protein